MTNKTCMSNMNYLKPRYIVDLPQHLADCEYNYYRLLKLMPGLHGDGDCGLGVDKIPAEWRYSLNGFGVDSSGSSLALAIRVREIAKYTTMLDVRVSPVNGLFSEAEPNQLMDSEHDIDLLSLLASYTLHVRLYHDAQLAEVVSSKGSLHVKPRHEYPNRDMHQCDEKSQRNQFLGELMAFCLAQGRIAYHVASA